MKPGFVLSTILTLMVVIGIGQGLAYAAQFRDPSSNVMFNYPSTYTMQEDNNDDGRVFIFRHGSLPTGKVALFTWQIKRKELEAEPSSLALIKYYGGMFKSMYNAVIYSNEVASYGGLDGARLNFLFPRAGEIKEHVVLEKDENFYIFKFSASKEIYEKHLPDFKTVLNSLQVPGVRHASVVSPADKSNSYAGMKEYKDPSLPCSFYYPADMTYKKEKNKFSFKNKGESAYISFEPMAYMKDGGKYKNSREMIEYLADHVKSQLKATIEQAAHVSKIGGNEVYSFDFSWKMEEQPLRQSEMALDTPERIYSFGLLGTPTAYRKYQQSFLTMVESFKYGAEQHLADMDKGEDTSTSDQAKKTITYQEISPAMVADLAGKLDLTHEQKRFDGNPGLIINYGKFKGNLMFSDCGPGNMCTNLELTTIFSDTSIALERVNDWNANAAYVKAYKDKEGYLIIGYDMDLRGGVTLENVMAFLTTFKSGVVTAAQHITKE